MAHLKFSYFLIKDFLLCCLVCTYIPHASADLFSSYLKADTQKRYHKLNDSQKRRVRILVKEKAMQSVQYVLNLNRNPIRGPMSERVLSRAAEEWVSLCDNIVTERGWDWLWSKLPVLLDFLNTDAVSAIDQVISEINPVITSPGGVDQRDPNDSDVFAEKIIDVFFRKEYNRMDDDQKAMVRRRVSGRYKEECEQAVIDSQLDQEEQETLKINAMIIWRDLCLNRIRVLREDPELWHRIKPLREAFTRCAISAINEILTKTKVSLGAPSSYLDDEDVARYKIKHATK